MELQRFYIVLQSLQKLLWIGKVSKFKKLINNPGIFIRDYLLKKYPIINSEQKYSEFEEVYIKEYETKLISLDETLEDTSNFDVDVVFTWVNNKDKNWKKKHTKYYQKFYQQAALYAQNNARFENHDEIYYSTYSVRKFLPWVNKIYIVTDGQQPILHSDCDNVIIIDHKEIIEDKYLPTFNSHVIEAHLHKIPALSENFIYFNDDVFVARPLEKAHFFRKNGIASFFVAKKSLQEMFKKGVKTPTQYASMNSICLLKKDYQINVDSPLVHTYIPLKKSICEVVFTNYQLEIEKFLSNKFRQNNDLNIATFLVPWVMYLESYSVMNIDICYYFNIRSPHALRQYRKLLCRREQDLAPHSFCANDLCETSQDVLNYDMDLKNILQKYYSI